MPPAKIRLETEIKLRVASVPALRRRLRQLRAREISARVHEFNTLYDTPEKSLYRGDKLVRLRMNRRRGKLSEVILTFKGRSDPHAGSRGDRIRKSAAPRYKIREEYEVVVSDGDQAAQLLAGLGLQPVFHYEKFRTTYRLPDVKGVRIELDETPLGPFLELEGSPSAIDRAASQLGYVRSEYITASYGELNRAASGSRGITGGDLLFNAAKKSR